VWKKSKAIVRGALRAAVDYIDQLLVLTAGIFFAVAGPAGWITRETLTAGIAAVLSVLAASLLRDRYQRERLAKEAKEALNETVQAISGDFPYYAAKVAVTWTLDEPNAEIARSVTERELRFIRNNVHAVHIWSRSTGNVVDHVAEGKRKGAQAFKNLPLCDPFNDRGRRRQTISLQDMLNAGELFELRDTRTLRGAFGDGTEQVSFEVEVPTDTAFLTVIWPDQRRPNELFLLRSRDWTKRSRDLVDRVGPRGGRQYTYSTEVSDPVQGEELTLQWSW
jgi:hypothetical protein